MHKLARLFYRFYLTLVLVFLLLPVGMIVLNSFSSAGVLQFPPPGFSLRWYQNLPLDYLQALRNSLTVGLMTTSIATVAGTPAAVALHRLRLPGMRALRALFLAPLMVPTLVIAVAALQFSAVLWDWAGIGMGGSLAGIAFAQAAFTTPFVIRAVLAAQAHLDPSLEEAARSLGATPLQAFVRASLPALMPGIAAGAFFAFVVSLDDVVVALFVGSGSSQTLPVKIYSAVEFNFDGGLLAISTVIIVLSLALALLFERYVGLSRMAAVTRA